MTLVIPNIEDSPTYQAQAVIDKTDLAAVSQAAQQNGVVSGCLVSAGTGLSVTVAAGVVVVAGTSVLVNAVSNVTSLYGGGTWAAAASDRRDIVIVNGSGVVSIVQGTATTESSVPWTTASTKNPPVKPAIPAGCVLLAEVYVPGSAASITAANITDKTTIVPSWSSSAAFEQLIRSQSLDQMALPAADLNLNGRRLTNGAAPLFSTDFARLNEVTAAFTATSSGPPTTGTWTVGQWVVTTSGQVYVCSTAGTPGPWAPASAYQFLTASATLGLTTSAQTVPSCTSTALGVGTYLVDGQITFTGSATAKVSAYLTTTGGTSTLTAGAADALSAAAAAYQSLMVHGLLVVTAAGTTVSLQTSASGTGATAQTTTLAGKAGASWLSVQKIA